MFPNSKVRKYWDSYTCEFFSFSPLTVHLVIVQSFSRVLLCDPMYCSTPGFPVLRSPRAYSNSCPLSWWCHLTISSSVAPFSRCPQFFPASESSQMSRLFASGGQNIGALASASVLPMNIQDWFPLGLTALISLLSKGLLRSFLGSTIWEHQFFGVQPSLWFNCHIRTYWINHSFDYTDLCQQNDVSAFIYAMFIIAFLPSSKCLLISWLQSLSIVVFTYFPHIYSSNSWHHHPAHFLPLLPPSLLPPSFLSRCFSLCVSISISLCLSNSLLLTFLLLTNTELLNILI